MTWFKVDDRFGDHPKVIAAGNAAVGMWIRCGAWCAQHGADGRVPKQLLSRFGTQTQANRLVEVGLWQDGGDVYVFRDWAEYQPLAAETQARRRERADAGKRGAEARWEKERMATAMAVASSTSMPPTRPDPTRISTPTNNSKSVEPDPAGGGFDQRYAEALDHAVQAELDRTHPAPRNPQAWAKAVRARIDRDHGAEISRAVKAGHPLGIPPQQRVADKADHARSFTAGLWHTGLSADEVFAEALEVHPSQHEAITAELQTRDPT